MKRIHGGFLFALAASAMACGDDASVAESASGSASGSGTGGTDSASVSVSATESAGDATDSNGSMSASQSGGTTGTDSMGDATQGDSLDSSGGTTDSGTTGGNTDSDTETTSDSDTDSGGMLPNEFPGVEDGYCAPPGETRYCYSGAPQTYLIGQCQPGMQECVAIDLDVGQWGPCEGEVLPEAEVCDGIDNDCDGEIDEDQGINNCGLGVCNHSEPACVNGSPNACDPFDGASMEICDGIDNDCDGDIDEGLGEDTVECGVGQCEHSVTACEMGQQPECDPFEGATDEVCDALDNDCDGQTDEGLPDITCGQGVCEHTIPSCINGFPQMCNPFEGASMEICDGLDNDCDGLVDEDQGVWECGEGMCQNTVPQCIDGVPQPESSCVPDGGGPEICGDGLDNNCDGDSPSCSETFVVGTDTTIRPIDVIWSVDSSGSMSQEMAVVEAEINDFADTLAASGSSTRLHLIADRGTGSFEICVQPPLGGNNCADNPPTFYQYDTNGGSVSMVHSSNALGRTMQQWSTWDPRLQPNSHIAFIVTTDDDGDDPNWVSPDDPEGIDDCQGGTGFITNATTGNVCRWDAPGNLDYTSLAYDWSGYGGFITFMQNFYAGYSPGTDWTYYSIIGNTGTAVLTGTDDQYEFNNCGTSVEDGDEYVKLSLYTETQDSMISICQANWDLSGLAQDIVAGVPADTYVLEGNPQGNCLAIDPATITVVVNGIPLNPADWVYDPNTCTLQIINNVPVVGDNVVITYDNF